MSLQDKDLPKLDKMEERYAATCCRLGHWKAAEIGATNFTASSSWLYKFLEKSGIVSRKVTDRVSRAKLMRMQEIEKSKTEFVATFDGTRLLFPKPMIWNSDQSGFEYEFTADRTLSWRGEAETVVSL